MKLFFWVLFWVLFWVPFWLISQFFFGTSPTVYEDDPEHDDSDLIDYEEDE